MTKMRNRLRRPTGGWVRVVGDRFTDWVRHSVAGAVIVGVAVGACEAGWVLVQRSSYFNIRQVEANETPHLDRSAIINLVGLEGPINIFKFDTLAAEEALGSHPWVAAAHVQKRMPDGVSIQVSERVPAAVVALGGLYVVDADGQPFVRTTPDQIRGLPLVTGLSREVYEANPVASRAYVRDALALGRLYQQSSLAAVHTLSNVHVGDGGRLELMLGKTRIVVGAGDHRAKLGRLEKIYETLAQRNMEASYILLDDKGLRSIVKEVPANRPIMGAL